MRIIGTGLIAGALQPFAERHPGAVAFAAGVSDSSCTDPAQYERERSLLLQTLDQASGAGERLIYFSSGGAVYGRWNGPASETAPLRPLAAYGHHKVACEELIVASGVGHLIVRLPNVVGDAGNGKQLLPSLVAQVLSGRVHVYSRAARDLVDSGDMARTVDALLSSLPRSAVVNVASGTSTAAEEIVREICRILDVAPDLELLDAGDCQVFDTSRLRQLLGQDPFLGEDYARSVLARHVPKLARSLGHARRAPDG